MVEEAEKYKNEDEKTRQRIEAKNSLENYAYNIRTTVRDEKTKNKISENDRSIIENKVKEVIEFIETSEKSEKEEFEEKEKELKSIADPIIAKLYQGNSMPDMNNFNSQSPADENNNQGAGPKIEEVD
mmetsp:Transcript_43433/g.90964  ORF Transcript_43433/g.90964 Transcript_43433/m.90964 type:complete len:128 (-) Transcript_43433:291-674(-)